MDAPEEDLDIKLQKISGDLIGEVDKRLLPLLRKKDATGALRVRSVIRCRDFARLTATFLDPFQELPQLLDPHLPKWLPLLAEAFLEHLQSRRRDFRFSANSSKSSFLMLIRTGICKLVYTFCKIRGEKVVVRFLNVETRYLELLLSALEDSESATASAQEVESTGKNDQGGGGNDSAWVSNGLWTWEERYVVLLWLSQLFFAPFDLSTISSTGVEDDDVPDIPGFQWPPNVPGITARVLPLAIKYLSVSSKERDAAKMVLVRIAMRKDMQEIGILQALIVWALQCLTPGKDEPPRSPYHYIGVLSFLAGILASSAGTSDLGKYLPRIFTVTIAATTGKDPTAQVIQSSAVARKTAIKVIRAIAIQILSHSGAGDDGGAEVERMEAVETTIDHLLTSLADNDTPVRLAASKALSMITLKLDPDMASQVVETVLEALNRNVLFSKTDLDPNGQPTRDVSAVDPLEWHGLMLTLSHLLYRRSPPATHLAEIIRALLMGLAFERRSTSGQSVGANVRDAACFGVWALARRYTTSELLAVPTTSTPGSGSILQTLATNLVVSASLDSAGNIRRGSSAALQELIGRHPNTIAEGIWVVQAVDYHAVALRSRAVSEVAMAATRLNGIYGRALIEALMGWRGIGDGDSGARRFAGAAIGRIMGTLAGKHSVEEKLDMFGKTVEVLVKRIAILKTRQVDERHGLLLSFAAVLDELPGLVGGRAWLDEMMAPYVDRVVLAAGQILEKDQATTFRKPELVAEAASRLFISLFPVLQVKIFGSKQHALLTGSGLVSRSHGPKFSAIVDEVDQCARHRVDTLNSLLTCAHRSLDSWLARPEQQVIDAASRAALILLVFSPLTGPNSRSSIISVWASHTRRGASDRTGTGFGFFFALAMAAPIVPHLAAEDATMTDASDQQTTGGSDDQQSPVIRAMSDRWAVDTRIETRVALLQALTQSGVLRHRLDSTATSQAMFSIIAKGLDDYTTNARGDIGSLVRLQAIRATKAVWGAVSGNVKSKDGSKVEGEDVVNLDVRDALAGLIRRVLRLAAEKLDRVRSEAHRAIVMVLRDGTSSPLSASTFSSTTYFAELLRLPLDPSLLHPLLAKALLKPTSPANTPSSWTTELMAGLVSSADTGNEDLVIASRAALGSHCTSSWQGRDAVCSALAANLKAVEAGDRVTVPALEVVAYLFHIGVWQRCSRRRWAVADGVPIAGPTGYKALCLLVQKAGYKAGNVRKLEACVKVYGAIAATPCDGSGGNVSDGQSQNGKWAEGKSFLPPNDPHADAAGVKEARKRLAALLAHSWPRIRSLVVDEMWGLLALSSGPGGGPGTDGQQAGKLKGIDWGKARKEDVMKLAEELGFV